jgi:hypothetical protein
MQQPEAGGVCGRAATWQPGTGSDAPCASLDAPPAGDYMQLQIRATARVHLLVLVWMQCMWMGRSAMQQGADADGEAWAAWPVCEMRADNGQVKRMRTDRGYLWSFFSNRWKL